MTKKKQRGVIRVSIKELLPLVGNKWSLIIALDIWGLFIMDKPIKHSSNIPEQLNKLTKRGLQFRDMSLANEQLSSIGYFNIINAYKKPFLLHPNENDEIFLPNTYFEDIFNVYLFDKELRRDIQSALETIEHQLREITCRKFIEHFGDDPEAYLNLRNFTRFNTGRSRNIFKKAIEYPALYDEKDPFKYYRNKYKGVPLWVAMIDWDFGTLKTFIQHLQPEVKNKVIEEFFSENTLNLFTNDTTNNNISAFFTSFLILANKFRNRVSHGYRVYNYRPTSNNESESQILQYTPVIHNNIYIDEGMYRNGYGQGDIFTLIKCMHTMRYISSGRVLWNRTSDNIIKHLYNNQNLDFYLMNAMGYPTDYISSLIHTILERNKKIKEIEPNINNIFNYYSVKLKDNSISVDSDVLADGLVNNIPY